MATKNNKKALKNEFTLVRGDFSVKEAKDALIGLVEDKIRHHRQRTFTMEERFGVASQHSTMRIEQLRQTLAELEELIAYAEKNNKTLRVNANIQVDLV